MYCAEKALTGRKIAYHRQKGDQEHAIGDSKGRITCPYCDRTYCNKEDIRHHMGIWLQTGNIDIETCPMPAQDK